MNSNDRIIRIEMTTRIGDNRGSCNDYCSECSFMSDYCGSGNVIQMDFCGNRHTIDVSNVRNEKDIDNINANIDLFFISIANIVKSGLEQELKHRMTLARI